MAKYMPDPTKPKPCDQCKHFGRWLPVDVAGVIRYDVHCWCANPGYQRVIAGPRFGCVDWATAQKNILK